MKTLITAHEIQKCAEQNQKRITVDKNTIVTPAAKDLAAELAVEVCPGGSAPAPLPGPSRREAAAPSAGLSAVDPQLIAGLVRQILAGMAGRGGLEKECHDSGLRLVRGQNVPYDGLNGGDPERRGIREIFTRQESGRMAAGFLRLHDSQYRRTAAGDEILFVVEGTVDCAVAGACFTGRSGDVFFVPAHVEATLGGRGDAVCFYVLLS